MTTPVALSISFTLMTPWNTTTCPGLEIQILTYYFHWEPHSTIPKGIITISGPLLHLPSYISHSGSSSNYSLRHPSQHPVSHPRLLPRFLCSLPKVTTSWPSLHYAVTLPSSILSSPCYCREHPPTGLPDSSHTHLRPSGSYPWISNRMTWTGV